MTVLVLDDLGEHLPGVEIGITCEAHLDCRWLETRAPGNHTFQEMVETSVTAVIDQNRSIFFSSHTTCYVRYLKLRPYPQRSTGLFRDANALDDSLSISLKVEGPLVERAMHTNHVR